jgi:pyruvate formate-lyase activating enzyme-like uncharacterized protein
MHDLAKGQRRTLDNIALAREYIPSVMVEMPILPDTLEEMKEVLVELDRLGIFGINLLELCFPLHNAEVFREKGYRVKARPFRVLYDYWYAGGLPIAGSELACLDLMEFALDSGLKIGLHYCSLENKHTGQIHRQNKEWNPPKRMQVSQKDFFLKSAKVFGNEMQAVRQTLDQAGYRDYVISEEQKSVEFHIDQIGRLKNMDIEVGISTNVIELRGGQPVLRELKVDVTTPQTFRLSKDI